ncbi:MAG: HD domain-containing protein [Deltaproteobacteria bacterium]|nr:HD domain-containing protein [Deltaproteobacteria bacterium]NIS78083.1 HD domain-containing protein [Deltaproteobacteria bacterium]
MQDLTRGKKQSTIARKFTNIIAILYVIPMLVTVYLHVNSELGQEGNNTQFSIIIISFLFLGIAGYAILRGINRSWEKTLENVKAVASGELNRRAETESRDEMTEFSENVNKITETLQKNVNELKESKAQIKSLLNHISHAVESPFELDRLLKVYLSSISNIIGFRKGVMAVNNDPRGLRIITQIGLTEDEKSAFLTKGKKTLNLVMEEKRPVCIIENSMPGENMEDHLEFQAFIGDNISTPLVKSHRVFGVLTMAAGAETCRDTGENPDGRQKNTITDDEMVMIKNLSAQISTAIENTELRKEMEKTYFDSITALAAAVEARDIYTNGHSKRVSALSGAIAREMNLPEQTVAYVQDASLLHDIGKIGIPDSILHEISHEMPESWFDVIKKHPVIGENIIKPLRSLTHLCPIVRHHHERFDGTGYPDGLSGENIPVESRVIAVADAFDAMTSDRPYRDRLTTEDAVSELKKNAGTQFDAEPVRALLRHMSSDSSKERTEIVP